MCPDKVYFFKWKMTGYIYEHGGNVVPNYSKYNSYKSTKKFKREIFNYKLSSETGI